MRDGVTIWTEGGTQIGMGHLVRCINIAGALDALGIPVRFLVNSDRAVIERLDGAGFARSASPAGWERIEGLTHGIVLIDTRKDVTEEISALKATGRKVVLLDNTV